MNSVTAFLGDRIVASGERDAVARELQMHFPEAHGSMLVFDDRTGRVADLDFGGAPAPRPPGRPKLGVKPREVTLLPRHWEWLAAQPGGASAALRRLVDEAQQKGEEHPRARKDAIYRFLQASCGDRPGYEEALRALYRGDDEGFLANVASWPSDILKYIVRLGERE